MGEVYLAREISLGRHVALKVLPSELTYDPQRVARFEQEARSASALSHPNICTTHALGELPDGRRFIAMEHVAGETLRHRLSKERLSLNEALDISSQVAAGVSAAHTLGIVHRDLKPENVIIRPDGLVKVIDFGLAKLALATDSKGDATTHLDAKTDPGSAVGTIAYMSPEQVRAQDVDARTDIWSLGAVLYEMVAGRTPFAGQSSSDVLAHILERDPAPLARFDPQAPPELQRIIGKALRKDRSQRYQTVQDLLLDVQALHADLDAQARLGSGLTGSTPTEQAGSRTKTIISLPRSKRRIVLASAAALIIGAGALGSWWWFKGRPPEASVISPSGRRNLTRLTFGGGLQTEATWSLDGRSIAYTSDQAGNNDIWVQSVAGGDPVQLTRSPAQDTAPQWSPDGRRIVFRSERDGGGLLVIPAAGGPERQIASAGWHPQWMPDGSEILFTTGGVGGLGLFVRLHAVSAEGGEAPRELLGDFLRGGGWDWIAPHPDGRISALGLHSQSGAGFFTVSRDGRHITRSVLAPGLPLAMPQGSAASGVGERIVRFQWNGTGTVLYVEAFVNEVRNVWRVRVEPKTLEWQSAEQLTAGPGADVETAVSRDGTDLAFTMQHDASRLWVFPFDAAVGESPVQAHRSHPRMAR